MHTQITSIKIFWLHSNRIETQDSDVHLTLCRTVMKPLLKPERWLTYFKAV